MTLNNQSHRKTMNIHSFSFIQKILNNIILLNNIIISLINQFFKPELIGN